MLDREFKLEAGKLVREHKLVSARHPNFARERSMWADKRSMSMSSENQIDLAIALRKLHELASADGDLGDEYWFRVGQLLKRAANMQSEIDALSRELEKCRAEKAKPY